MMTADTHATAPTAPPGFLAKAALPHLQHPPPAAAAAAATTSPSHSEPVTPTSATGSAASATNGLSPMVATATMAAPAPPLPGDLELVHIPDQVSRNGLFAGQWADTVLCVSSPTFSKAYPVHALLLARAPAFRDRLLHQKRMPPGAVLPPMGATGARACLPLPDEAALANIGFVRGRDFLHRIDVVLPELATEDAMGVVLTYIYNDCLPPTMPADLAIAVLTVASALHLPAVANAAAQHIRAQLSLATLPQFLPLLSSPPHAPLVTSFLAASLAALPAPLPGLPHPFLGDGAPNAALVSVYAQLPWPLLKSLIEETVPDLSAAFAPATASAGSDGESPVLPPNMDESAARRLVEHGRFEFAQRVLAERGMPEESVVVMVGKGATGVALVRRGEKRKARRMWRVGDE